ncbi:uncharacterized protein LOC133304610 [Gastrolobium bilobum]|uniref:uncharacterized protein LOC133304610 n=1 Tax=Gastrolobium bilobum TaxID=150636 RepID=UPI002AAFF3B8|nr:uncharacterized protein LOC133304610 [Gastrolobium bilobum]
MISWSIELSEYDIIYEPRQAIKAQVLADFLVEMTHLQEVEMSEEWVIFVDGSSNVKGSGAGVIVESLQGITVKHSIHFGFKASNNQAEYEAVLAGLAMVKDLGATNITLKSDSQLVIAQVQGNYQEKEALMIKYLEKVRLLLTEFQSFKMEHIPREQNSRADILSKLASTKGPGNNRSVIQQSVPNPSIIMAVTKQKAQPSQNAQSMVDDDNMPLDDKETWMTPIWNYLVKGEAPQETRAAKKLSRKASFYTIINNQLYKKRTSHGREILILKTASYRLLLAKKHVRQCVKCQEHADLHHAPPEELSSMLSPWPFYQWGMDILGPFPIAMGGVKWLLVAIDYFTKWIEAEALATISAKAANRVLKRGLERRLEAAKIDWPEQLDFVLWGYRTTKHSTSGETPFRMVYGSEAMIPVEIGEPSWRRMYTNEDSNSQALLHNLDAIEEAREVAHVKEIALKQRIAARYNSKVVRRSFNVGDLVLRRADIGNKNTWQGKLAANWEGPYRIYSKTDKGEYVIETLSGLTIPRTWNADKLKTFYS